MTYKIFNEDCLKFFRQVKDSSIDLILADPPYGTTKNRWDSIIPLDEMWQALLRIIKPNGAILLCCQDPFTSILITSNLSLFRYKWVWQKTVPTGHLNANKMPMKYFEEVAVFYKTLPKYNPQLRKGAGYSVTTGKRSSSNYGKQDTQLLSENDGTSYKPKDVIGPYPTANSGGKLHPTQKPLSLMEYLILTYSDKGDTVLDFCMGSGTTGEAAIKLGRNFVGCETDKYYFSICESRLGSAEKKKKAIDNFLKKDSV